MAIIIIVETGEGLPESNSYITPQFASDYADTSGNTNTWCNNVSKQNLALVQAARFLDLRYGNRFKGVQLNPEQGLLYPRRFKAVHCGQPSTPAIPKALKMAQAQLAIQFLTDGTLDLNANATNNVIETSVSVGNGAVQETLKFARPVQQSFFSVADGYIDQLTQGWASAFVPTIRG